MFVVATVVVSAPAVAQTDQAQRDSAQKLVDQGLKAARGGSFGAAAEKFEAALKLYPHPEIAHNLARAQEELGNPVLAIAYFRQALEMDAGYTFAVDARQRIGALDKELRATHGVLKVSSTPAQVLVSVETNGVPVARELMTPTSVYIQAGDATVRGTKREYLDAEQVVSVAAGQDVAVELLLRPVPKKGFLSITAGVPSATVYVNGDKVGEAPVAGHPLEVGRYEVRVTAPEHDDWLGSVDVTAGQEARVAAAMQRTLDGTVVAGEEEAGLTGGQIGGYALIGVGGATAVAAIATTIVWKMAESDARSVDYVPDSWLVDDPDGQALALKNELDAEHRKHANRAETFRNVSVISYAAAAGLIGVGVVLVVLDAGEPEPEASEEAAGLDFTPTVVLHPERVGVGATLRF